MRVWYRGDEVCKSFRFGVRVSPSSLGSAAVFRINRWNWNGGLMPPRHRRANTRICISSNMDAHVLCLFAKFCRFWIQNSTYFLHIVILIFKKQGPVFVAATLAHWVGPFKQCTVNRSVTKESPPKKKVSFKKKSIENFWELCFEIDWNLYSANWNTVKTMHFFSFWGILIFLGCKKTGVVRILVNVQDRPMLSHITWKLISRRFEWYKCLYWEIIDPMKAHFETFWMI